MQDGLINAPEDLYNFIKDYGYKVLANIIFAGSPGHQIQELDYFLRKYRAGEIPANGRYLWIQREGPITETLRDVYNAQFRQYNLGMLVNDAYTAMAAEITRMRPDLGIDVGVSHIKNSVMDPSRVHVARFADQLYYHVTNDEVVRTYMDYYRLRRLTADFDPWTPSRPAIDEEFAEFLGGDIDRLAVIHFRTGVGNAGVAIPAENLFPTIEFLKESGYAVIKIGTEAFPEEFARFGVVNYSESKFRSFRNDLALLCHAKLAVINASGLENLVDTIGIPTVSYARWHIALGPYSSRTVVVPSMLYDPERQRLLTFAEQILFFKTRQEFWEGRFFGWHFPIDRYIARVPQPDEMLAATREAIALGEGEIPLSALQARFNKLDEVGVLSVVESRISDFFLDRFQSYF